MSKPINVLNEWFKTGKKPTQEQFWELIDSFWHKDLKIPMGTIKDLDQILQEKVDTEIYNAHLTDADAHSSYLAKLDASNLSPENIEAWKATLNVGELPPNIATIDDGTNAGNVYTKMQSDEAYMQKSLYTNGEGKILADMIEALGLTRVKKFTEHTIAEFAANSANYEFEESDIIALPSTDPEPTYSLYFYTGGDKTNVDNYLPTGFSNVTMSMVDGLIDALNSKIDKPGSDGKFYIKRASGVTTTEPLTDETLDTVVNRGSYSSKPITFLSGSQSTYGQIGVNPTTYSFFWGNLNPAHTGIYNHSFGYNALSKVTTGNNNLAFGTFALKELTTGKLNTVVGIVAAENATTGNCNVIVGEEGADKMTTGYKNTIIGTCAAYSNTTGNLNVNIGYKACNTTVTGDRNIVIGAFAAQGFTGTNSIIMGVGAAFNDGALANKLIIHSNNTLTGYGNDPAQEGSLGSYQQGQLNRALITGDFLDRWVRFNASGGFTVATPGTTADDITINPSTGIVATKQYTPQSNNDYIQRGYLFANYYNQTQIDSMISRAYRVMGSVDNFTSLPLNDGTRKIGEVWNVLDTGDNYVWVDNLNNTGNPGWDKLSGIVDLSGYATKDYVDNQVQANLRPYKVYVCLLQAGGTLTPSPSFVQLENTIGAIIWTRTNVGEYIGTLNGAFPMDKVVCFAQCAQGNGGIGPNLNILTARLNNDSVYVKVTRNDENATPFEANGQFGSLEIRVYN